MSAPRSRRTPSASGRKSRIPPIAPKLPGPGLRTPKRDRTAHTHQIPSTTPQAKGVSALLKGEHHTGNTVKYDSDKYIDYIAEDFEQHRVFIGMEPFMEHVLHVPKDWKTKWGPTIEGIKTDPLFEPLYEAYISLCDTFGCLEKEFYEPLVDMVNGILHITSDSPVECVRPLVHQRYIVNDPKKVMCGILNEKNLSPDIVAVHQRLLVRVPQNDEVGNAGPEEAMVENTSPEEVNGGNPSLEQIDDENPFLEENDAENPFLEEDDTESLPLEEIDTVMLPPEKDKVESSPPDEDDDESTPLEEEDSGNTHPKEDDNGIIHPKEDDDKNTPPPKDDYEDILPGLDDKKPRLNKANLTWAQPLQVLEVKPFDTALVNGLCMPRLKNNGKDPLDEHMERESMSRHKKTAPRKSAPDADGQDRTRTESMNTRKRCAPESSDRGGQSTTASRNVRGKGNTSEAIPRSQTGETKCQQVVSHQVGKYLLEQFSVPAFRSHATIGLVDRDRIQFYHANHSVILVSPAIRFGKNDKSDGLNMLIAIVIAFSRLSLRDSGILHDLMDGNLLRGNKELVTSGLTPNVKDLQNGRVLEFALDGKAGTFKVVCGELITREPSLVGRSTVVLHATSPTMKKMDLVVKINWPTSGRVSESVFLKKAAEKAREPSNRWARKHLPLLVFDRDIEFGTDSTHKKVATYFRGTGFISEEYVYEERTLRIIVQERLRPLMELTDAKEIAQVLLDIGCIHRWLYEEVGILHRDLSPNNIMYRRVKGKIYGVLMDFDLSSWKTDLAGDYTKTSQQRTGTPPYMAYGLLDGSEPLHMYRHDVESLFYIMLILATHYTIEAPRGRRKGGVRMRGELWELPYRGWFKQPSYDDLSGIKWDFLSRMPSMHISPSFEDFRNWLEDIRLSFNRGVYSLMGHRLESKGQGTPPFDNETLGGHINYSALINPARGLKGKLEGLIIRYEPDSSVPHGTGFTNANQTHP